MQARAGIARCDRSVRTKHFDRLTGARARSPHRGGMAGGTVAVVVDWSERRDLNPRPPVPQTDALPGCATLRPECADVAVPAACRNAPANGGQVMKLDQVTVIARDYDASVAFYRALGLTQIVAAPPRYARFECENGATFSLHLDAAGEAPGGTVVYFELDDLDATVERLKRQGMTFSQEPRDERWLWRRRGCMIPRATRSASTTPARTAASRPGGSSRQARSRAPAAPPTRAAPPSTPIAAARPRRRSRHRPPARRHAAPVVPALAWPAPAGSIRASAVAGRHRPPRRRARPRPRPARPASPAGCRPTARPPPSRSRRCTPLIV